MDAASGVAELGPEAPVAVCLSAEFRLGIGAGVGVEEGDYRLRLTANRCRPATVGGHDANRGERG